MWDVAIQSPAFDHDLKQIWSLEHALLLVSCRGHEGEITDLAVSCDNTMVASSSNDTTIRCWDLKVPLFLYFGKFTLWNTLQEVQCATSPLDMHCLPSPRSPKWGILCLCCWGTLPQPHSSTSAAAFPRRCCRLHWTAPAASGIHGKGAQRCTC
jgi:hypothetical protein